MKFAWIQTEKASYPLTKLCRWLGVTPSGFYAWRQRPESTHAREDRRLKVLVQASFAESKQRYGSPRIHEDLIEQDEQVSRGSGLASELRAQGDFLSVAACEVRPEARKPVTHVHGP